MFNRKAKITLFRVAMIFLIILILLGVILFASIMFANAKGATQTLEEIEQTKIKKSYFWLESQSKGRWNFLTTEQHVFSFLALKEKLAESDKNAAITSLLFKSENKKCWPKSNCNARETALSKIMLDSMQQDTRNISNWLLNQTIPTAGIEWYLQLTSPYSTKLMCNISYSGASNNLFIDEKNIVSGTPGNCFEIYDKYWLKLKPECSKYSFNVSCNDSSMANFLFKKGTAWYVTSEIENLYSGDIREMQISSYCIKNPSNVCDYEATAWAAYSFKKQGDNERVKIFLPYLITFKEENKKYFPDAFLYALTENSEYEQNIETIKGNSYFILLNPSQYNEFYDSALAMVMTVNYGSRGILNSMKTQLLERQSTRGNWEISSGDSQRETALILLGFWPDFVSTTECESLGYSCVSNCSSLGTSQLHACGTGKECCQIASVDCVDVFGMCAATCGYNQVETLNNCEPGKRCCKNYGSAYCVSEIGGNLCTSDQKCLDANGEIKDFITSKDLINGNYCCIGVCSTPSGICSDLGGSLCNINEGNSCPSDNWLHATDELSCCTLGYCSPRLVNCADIPGEKCTTDETCKDGQLSIALDTDGEQTCCARGKCIPNSCEAFGGIPCDMGIGESCTGTTFETGDSRACCIGGICTLSCSEKGGEPCSSGMICKGKSEIASNTDKCCIGECKEKSGFPWWILILILFIFLGIITFFLIKKSKSDKGGAGPSNKDNKQKPKYNSFSMLNQGVQRHSLMQRPTLIQNQNKKPVGIPLPPTP